MIVTTTDTIVNKKTKSYLGIVNGMDLYMVGGAFGGGLINQEKLYSTALKNAMDRMEQKATEMGANAIVGVALNVTSPGGSNFAMVSVTGTAIVVED